MTVENLFAIQSEIAREVVLALNGVLSEQDDTRLDRLPTISLEAYGEYVLGRQEMAKRTVKAFDKAITYFEKAIELDPDYAMPYVGLASSTHLRADYSRPRQDISEVSGQVQSLIDKALSLDPLSGEAWAALGLLRKVQGNNEEAEKYYLKAIELSPNYATAYHWYSNFLNEDESSWELSLQYIQKATELDPLADVLKINLANTLRKLGRVDENLDVLKQGHAKNPDFILYYGAITTTLIYGGQIAEALRWSLEGARRAPNHRGLRYGACELLLNLVADQLTEQCLLKLMEDFPNAGYFITLSDMYALAGEHDKALTVMLDEHHPEVPEQWHKEVLAIAYLRAGQTEKARDIANSISPRFFSDEPVSVPFNEIGMAITAIFLLKTDSRVERAGALGDAILETVNAWKRKDPADGYHFVTILVAAGIGDRPGALAALREAIDSGWRKDWWHLRQPELDHMREEPEWNAMMDELEADINRQREWFLAHRDDPLR
jgi:tetratricopeptide (TPR) repeat protein